MEDERKDQQIGLTQLTSCGGRSLVDSMLSYFSNWYDRNKLSTYKLLWQKIWQEAGEAVGRALNT